MYNSQPPFADCRRDIRVIADVSKEDLSRDVMQKFIATMASSMRKEHTFLAYPYNVRKPNTVDIVKDYSRHSKLEENVKKGLSVTAHERRAEEILLLLTDSLITEDAVKLLKARVPQPLLIEVNGVQKNRTVADVPADVFPQLNDALDFAVLKIKYLMPNC